MGQIDYRLNAAGMITFERAILILSARLRPDAVNRFQTTAGDKLSQIIERSDFEFLMQHRSGLGTDARQL